MTEGEQKTLEEQVQALREELEAERDRADRFRIEAYIMREMACRTRDIAVAFGCQVLPNSKPYAEEVKPLMENPVVLETEIERRLERWKKRERRRED